MPNRGHDRSLSLVVAFLAVLSVPSLRAQAIYIEGESYTRTGGAGGIRILEREGTYGGKVVSYWEEPGVWLEWDFEVPRTDSYCISVRYACRWPDTTRRIELDGTLPHRACEGVRFAGTGDWAAWRFHTLCDAGGVPILLQLAQGKHRIRMVNVDSRGLAVDVMALHGPALLFDDVAVEGKAAASWGRAFAFTNQQEAQQQALISKGTVRVTLDRKSAGESMRAASTLFSLWLPGLDPAAGQAPPPVPVSVVSTGRTARLDACLLRVSRYWQVLISDGKTLHVILGDASRGLRPLPLLPLVYMQAEHLRRAVTWRTDAGELYVKCGPADAAPSSVWTVGAARLLLSHAWDPKSHSLQGTDGIRVAAVKICPPAWSEKGLGTEVESEGNRDVVHSSGRDLPALAEFYGYARFTAELEWGDDLERCALNDLAAGERAVLWPKPTSEPATR